MVLPLEQKLLDELGIGKSNVQSADDLSLALGLDAQRTDEALRQLIRDCIVNKKWPIGSNAYGYFLIESDQEFDQVIQGLQARIQGIQERIVALEEGWNKRKQSSDWPK